MNLLKSINGDGYYTGRINVLDGTSENSRTPYVVTDEEAAELRRDEYTPEYYRPSGDLAQRMEYGQLTEIEISYLRACIRLATKK